MRSGGRPSTAVGLVLFVWSFPSFGQAPPGDAPATPSAPPPPASAPAAPPAETPEVRVIGSHADALQHTPGSGTVITTQDIVRADPYNLAEMLNRVPGLLAREEQGGGYRLDIGFRGLDPGRSRHELVLEDGVPISLNPYAEPDLYYSPQIERMRGIEVVKGSGDILFGPQTIGGVINFLTIAPPDHQHAVVDAEYGQRNYVRALGQYGDTLGSARYVLQAFYKQGSGFRDEAFATTDVFGKVAFDTGKRGQATVKLGFHDDRADSDDVGLTREMYQQDPSRPTLAPFDKEHLQKFDASVVDEEPVGDATKIKTIAYAYQTSRIWNRQNFVRNPYDANDPGPGEPTGYQRFVGDPNMPGGGIYFLDTDTILDRTYQVAGVEPKAESRFSTGIVGHTLEAGARLLGETAHYQQRTGDSPTSDAGTNDAEEHHRTIAVAGYVSDRIAFLDKLVVTPGLRLEYADFRRTVNREPLPSCPPGVLTCAADVNLSGDYSAAGVIPGIGIVYGTRALHVFGGLHVGWAPPRISDSYSPNGTPLPVSPEKSINYELGTRLTPTKWLHVETTGFILLFQNQVIPGSNANGAELVDGGPTKHFGVENAVTVRLSPLVKAIEKARLAVDLGGRYTFQRATFVGGPYNDNLLAYAPLHVVSANLDVDHPFGIGAQIAYLHVSSQFADQADTRAEDATGQVGIIPAYNVVDANLHYHNEKTGLTIRFVVKNALNDLYIIARRPQGIFVSGFREGIVGVRWDWDRHRAER